MRASLKCVALVCLAGSMVMVTDSRGEDRDPSLYAGTKSCRMCHKKDTTGNQYEKWLAGPHANAVKRLGDAESKAVASKLGIDDPQKSGACLKCHSTAYHWTEAVKTTKVPVKDAVSCESCHGPGKNYKSKSVMQSRERSVAKGMVHPATKSCVLCHNDQSPTWKPDRYTTAEGDKVGFDPKQASEKTKHPNPKSKK